MFVVCFELVLFIKLFFVSFPKMVYFFSILSPSLLLFMHYWHCNILLVYSILYTEIIFGFNVIAQATGKQRTPDLFYMKFISIWKLNIGLSTQKWKLKMLKENMVYSIFNSGKSPTGHNIHIYYGFEGIYMLQRKNIKEHG